MSEPHVMFLCWGNICRSPMAERVARQHAVQAGIEARFTSGGVSSEELGRPMDRRARRTLEAHGYDGDGHTARQVGLDELAGVNLVVAAEQYHLDRLQAVLGEDGPDLALVSDFDPEGHPGEGLPDPWYGDEADFEVTLQVLERSMPALLERLRRD